MISVESVTKRYGTLTAVDQLTFQVDRGEVVGNGQLVGAGSVHHQRAVAPDAHLAVGELELQRVVDGELEPDEPTLGVAVRLATAGHAAEVDVQLADHADQLALGVDDRGTVDVPPDQSVEQIGDQVVFLDDQHLGVHQVFHEHLRVCSWKEGAETVGCYHDPGRCPDPRDLGGGP
jgi:hypothetical protein